MNISTNITIASLYRMDGYHLPIYGLANGEFYNIHIPAICIIFTSLLCAIITLIVSLKGNTLHTFYKKRKSERFVVYLALSDGLFNACHSLDHLHIIITKNHVYPKKLCVFYGFMLTEFITAQNLMVNVIAINAFVRVYFRKNMDFGKYDWKFLTWSFGLPFVGATVCAALGVMGPNGTYCHFDGVRGKLANILLSTVLLLLILLVNIIMYALVWYRIRREEPMFTDISGNEVTNRIRASHNAAKNMCLFVAAFFIQWWSLAVYGVWDLVDENVPQIVFQLVTTFVNTGNYGNNYIKFTYDKNFA